MLNSISKKSQLEKWNEVYEDESKILPWTGLSFSSVAEKYLNLLDKKECILVTGCGIGDTANNLYLRGFNKVIGTDISDVAIQRAQKTFPYISFKTIPTEKLDDDLKLVNVNTIDWLNLHQVEPESLRPYILSLIGVSRSVCIAWIFHEGEEKNKSYVHEGNIYFHNPKILLDLFIKHGFKLVDDGKTDFISSGVNKVKHCIITQTYVKS